MSSNPASHNGTAKWLIALGVSVALALGGWTFGGFKAAEVRGIAEVRLTANEAKGLSVQNDREIAVLKSQLFGITGALQEIKDLLKEHERKAQ
jgi:uncharacterized protein HemX